MNSALRQKAIELRTKKRMSYGMIQKEIGVPKSTLSYWLAEYHLTENEILELRRASWRRGEASRERFRNTMRTKREEKNNQIYVLQKKKFSKITSDVRYVAGLMLYLAEGAKTDPYRIDLANTDPWMISFFIDWMREFLDVDRKVLRVELHLYENMEIPREVIFWEKITGISSSRFYKTQIRKIKPGSFTYQGSHRHGTCNIIFNSVEKKRELSMAIKAFVDTVR